MYGIAAELACFVVGFGIGTIALARLKGKTTCSTVNESFFPQLTSCRVCLKLNQVCQRQYCGFNKFRKFTYTLEMATKKIDICVCLITLRPVVYLIANLADAGINIRIICDKAQMTHGTFGSQSRVVFKRHNITVKEAASDQLMHHKFAVVDSKILINGSMNWTLNGFFGNYENVEITDNKHAVAVFQQEFNKLWELIE